MLFPYSKQNINLRDEQSVLKALKNKFITQGPLSQKFEKNLSKVFNSKYVLVCNSGTAALHLAYSAIGLGPENGLITSPITFVATANAAKMCNAPVAFADVDKNTGNLTLTTIKKAIKRANFKVKAICLVHLGGRPCPILEIYEFAKKNNIKIIEDACHAPLAMYRGKNNLIYNVGACKHSEITTLSMHAIKHFTSAEGGVLLTNNKKHYIFAKKMASHGIIKEKKLFKSKMNKESPWYYEMQTLGYNYRLSEINCALGLSQLSRLKQSIKSRNNLAQAYCNYLKGASNISLPEPIDKKDGKHAWHLFAIKVNFKKIKISRSTLIKKLYKYGVGTQVHYIPLYRQPFYKESPKGFIGAEEYYSNTISLPMYYGLNKKDIKKISSILIKIIES